MLDRALDLVHVTLFNVTLNYNAHVSIELQPGDIVSLLPDQPQFK